MDNTIHNYSCYINIIFKTKTGGDVRILNNKINNKMTNNKIISKINNKPNNGLNSKSNKKAAIDISIGIVIILITAVLILAVVIPIVSNSFEDDCSLNIPTLKAWVEKRAMATKVESKLPIQADKNPPFTPLCKSIEITKVDQILSTEAEDSSYKIIADSMLDCWRAFGEGKLDFIGNDKIFCYPCRIIEFSDNVKTSRQNIREFNMYLYQNSPYLGDNPKSYHELLGNDPAIIPEQAIGISTSQPLYIYFVATKGITYTDIVKASGITGGVGLIVGAGIAIGTIASGGTLLVGLGIIAATGAMAGVTAGVTAGAGGFIAKSLEKNEFDAKIQYGSSHDIIRFCNAGKTLEQRLAAENQQTQVTTPAPKKEASAPSPK